MIHWLNPEWRTTYCGWRPESVGMVTTTPGYVECEACLEARELLTQFREAEAHQFGE